MIELKSLIDLILIVLTLKLVVSQWTPPIQKSKQALICLTLGSLMGVFCNTSKEGFITGLIGSSFAFYGGELIQAFKNVAEDVDEFNNIKK